MKLEEISAPFYTDEVGKFWFADIQYRHVFYGPYNSMDDAMAEHSAFIEEQTKDSIIYEIERLLDLSYTKEGASQWWDRPRSALDGMTPKEAIDNGLQDKVLALAQSMDSGNFI